MDGDTRRDGDKAEDIVALDRVAALGQLILYIVDFLVDNQRIRAALRGRIIHLLSLRLLLLTLSLGSCHAALLLRLARNPLLEDILDVEEVNLLLGNHRIDLAARAHLQHLAKIGHSLVDGNIYLPVLQLALQLLTAYAGVLHLLGTQE